LTLNYFIHDMSDESCENLIKISRTKASEFYNSATSYEKFVFNSNYALLNVMQFGFQNDLDYEVESLNKRMGALRYLVDYNKNRVGDEDPFYPFIAEFAIIGGRKEPKGYHDTPYLRMLRQYVNGGKATAPSYDNSLITVSGELVIYTGADPEDDSGLVLRYPISPPNDGRNARDLLNLYFSIIVSCCVNLYPNEDVKEFKYIANSWIDDKEVVPQMWATLLRGQPIVNPFD
ncbi:MAG: hypothetical protein LBM93_09740, partial [Oscillospiraceae bacterium]|nr:hypothetical protein [Oscillospiraceae bacterium]